jgi:hypothetical protein
MHTCIFATDLQLIVHIGSAVRKQSKLTMHLIAVKNEGSLIEYCINGMKQASVE